MFIDHEEVARLKKQYPANTRIRLIKMGEDPRPIESGACGTVESVDDIGTIHVRFDNGRLLGLMTGEDEFQIINA